MSGLGRTGGFYPGPSRTGGAYPLTRRVLESLQGGRGSAWSTQPGTAVYVENLAYARAIAFDLYEVSQRMANQFTPYGATVDGLLPRWEAIFGLHPLSTDTEQVRQARLAGAWANMVETNRLQQISDNLTAALGPAFVGISPVVPPSDSVVWWPAGPGAMGLGSAVKSTPAVPWYNSSCCVRIQLQVPAGWTLQQFHDARAMVGPLVDPVIRAWETWVTWVANPAGQPPIGFYFNQPNLDWSLFRV